jgi:hypothetical protein
MSATTSENLFHVKLQVTDLKTDPSGAKIDTSVLGTFGSLQAAKTFASVAMEYIGFTPDEFQLFAVHGQSEPWKYGDGTIVHSVAPAGQIFEVQIETEPNSNNLPSNAHSGRVEGALHHVLQQTINYNDDRTGAKQETEIEGTFLKRADARAEAIRTLLDDQPQEYYAKYEVRKEGEEWDWGEDAWAHAVGPDGENFTVYVLTELAAGQGPKKHPHRA